MTAGDLQAAIISYVNWWQNLVVPEFSIDDGSDRADVLQITKAGFAVEYEIKVSADDWRKDLAKPKWAVSPATGNRYVSRFFYVVPGRARLGTNGKDWASRHEPAIKVPARLPASVGIILVMPGRFAAEWRAARRFKVEPLPEKIVRRAMDCFYYRYWRMLADFERARDDFRTTLERQRRTA